jgi:hypothetical protein
MRVLLTGLFMLVVLALGLSITAITYNRMKEASLSEARTLFDRTSTSLAQTFVQNRLEIGYGLAVAAGSALSSAPSFPQRFAAKDQLLGLLQSNPLIRTAYVGYSDGDFLLIRHVLRSDRPPARIAPRAAFFSRSVERNGKTARARSWFYDDRLQFLAMREEPRFRFDPRQRPWFTGAGVTVRVTAPYLSFGNGRMGVSLTKRTAYGSVLATDVDLQTLSVDLARLRPTASSLAALITPAGVVLGYSDPERLVAVNSGRRDRPALVDDLGAAPISAGFHAVRSTGTDTSGTYTDPRGRTWLFGVVPGRDAEGKVLGYDRDQRSLSRLVILSIPEDELLSTALRVRNESLLLCLALIVTMVPFAYLLSQLIAHPMVGLRQDALSLRNLDFSERPPRTSVITEIGEFSDTFGAMRSHIREHNDAAAHFVPREFLELLERRDLRSLQLGDHTERVMTMLFSDIRG